MFSTEKESNSSNENIKFWQDFSSYKKALYLSQNAPDCCFVLNLGSNNSKTFYAHKSILQSASPVFETMFQDKIIEANISHTEPQVFKKFLDFIYYGDVENLHCADASTLRLLISLGKQYKVEDLIKNCIETMKLNLANAENYDLVNIFEYACLMEDNELIKECKRVIVGRAKPNPKFQDFNLNQQQDEKRHIAQARKQLNGSQGHTNKPTATSAVAAEGGFGAASSNNDNSGQSKITNNVTASHAAGNQNVFGKAFNAGTSNKSLFGSSSGLFGATSTQLTSVASNQTQQPSFAFSSTPTSQPAEEKLQNTENNKNDNLNGNIFNLSIFPIGVNKGNITDCACIYGLNPSVFYEFQITLSGYISELLRFNMIETYAKINGLMDDDVDAKFKELATNKSDNANIINLDENTANASVAELPKQSKIALSKQILNMMLHSIKFHRMTAKEFCSGPGKSSLLDMSEKYDLLVTIVNKN